MRALPVQGTVDLAWWEALSAASAAPGGRLLHLIVTTTAAGSPSASLIAQVDALVGSSEHSVATVASTVFPASLYRPPSVTFSPNMAAKDLEVLDAAAEDLYGQYRQMLPVLQTMRGNSHGTYFGRLVSWPGKDSDGYNQLAVRVRQLRNHRKQQDSSANAADLTVEGVAEQAVLGVAGGLQIYKGDDERQRSFPCLIHLDISVLDGRLHVMALYRNWHLIHKALGNLLGLSRLQLFLSQQTGYPAGELMIHATVADSQFKDFGSGRITQLLKQSAPAVGRDPR